MAADHTFEGLLSAAAAAPAAVLLQAWMQRAGMAASQAAGGPVAAADVVAALRRRRQWLAEADAAAPAAEADPLFVALERDWLPELLHREGACSGGCHVDEAAAAKSAWLQASSRCSKALQSATLPAAGASVAQLRQAVTSVGGAFQTQTCVPR